MDHPAFLSVRIPRDIHARMKAAAAERGEKLQDLIGGLIAGFLAEAERRPPELAETIRRLRPLESRLRARGIAALYVFGSVARGDARPDSDVDLAIDVRPRAELSLLDLAHLAAELEEALGRRVDLGERATLLPHVAAGAAGTFVRVF